MPLFTLTCLDKPDALPRRLQARPAHLAHVGAHGAAVKLAGPLLSDDLERPIGSFFVLDMPDAAAVAAFNAADPYVAADVFGEVTIRPFRVVVGSI
jgi:uncharacterized protein YciI